MKQVLLLSMGGTIASGKAGLVPGPELLKHLGVASDDVALTVEEVQRTPSSLLTPSDMVALARRICQRQADRRHDAIIVTHGTDTLEESAFVADMLCGDDVPVVFTGAMRPGPKGDGPQNIRDAMLVGLSPPGGSQGVLVVLDRTAHAASEVRKIHATGDDAFFSHVPAGHVDDSGFQRSGHEARRWRLSSPEEFRESEVWLIRLACGGGTELIDAAIAAGVEGIVIEVFGAGNVPPQVLEKAMKAALGCPVVCCSRTGAGAIELREGKMLVSASGLDGLKARLALMAALNQGLDQRAISKFFHE